ncbi:MAG TPA: hypothetical protein VIS96_16845 [Terrimicrobiaceae bacterium]
MATTRKNRPLALCLGTVLIFLAQSMFCFAEHAGLIPCPTEQHQDGDRSDDQRNAPSCSHVHSHGALVIAETVGVLVGDPFTDLCLRFDDGVPDGPVREIEYPPQLS